MLHTITHGKLSASIASLGAELTSFKDTANDDEYIWQRDPNSWQGSAPILFPIVGRLNNGRYQFNGNTYQLNKHGFARTSEFVVQRQQNHCISFVLQSSVQTREVYPFEFVFVVDFTLDASGLHVSYHLKNTGKATQYFTLGSHPALRLPLDTSRLDDYLVEFEQAETLDCYFLQDGLLTDQPIAAYLNNARSIPIHAALFDNDALIFKNIRSQTVALKHRQTGVRLTMHTGGAPHFGLWAKPNAPFICFEPWYSHDDPIDTTGELISKPGMMALTPGASFETGYQLRLG